MFKFIKYNKKKSDAHDCYILEDSPKSNKDIIIDIPMLEDNIFENNLNESLKDKITNNKKTLFNMLKEESYFYQKNIICKYTKPRLYKKYNYMDYPFYNNK